MAITTRNFPNLYSPIGDPTLELGGKLYIPDPAIHPPPWHCMVGTHAPGMRGSGDFGVLERPFGQTGGMAEAGILCLAFGCRSDEPANVPGQTTTGVYPQQTDDCKQVIRMMRQDAWIETEQGFSVTGFVGITGPSGAAGHAVFCVVNGTEGDDLADACIGCSSVTNFADRSAQATRDGSQFVFLCAKYGDLPDTDLVGLRAKSPVAFVTANAKPCQVWNGTNENMPLTQLTGEDGLTANMVAAGALNYDPHINEGVLAGKHGFAMWDDIKLQAVTWLVARMAEFSGHEPPPPPEETGRVKVTATITGLAPDLPLTLNVAAHDNTTNLDGPVSQFDFISDKADTGGTGAKDAPVGVYALVDAVDGVITGNIAARAWWGYAYVNGGILPTTWGALNPNSRESFDWSQTDAFLAAAFDNDKQAGIAISMGVKNPPWIYTGQHAVPRINVDQPNAGTIPIPWAPNYLGSMKQFVQTMALRYREHPNLSYIVCGGMGQLLDTLLVQSAGNYTNLNNSAVEAGYPNAMAGWAATSAGILDLWQKAWQGTTAYLAINVPVPVSNGGLIGIDEFARSSVQRYKARLGLMTLGLDGLTAADSNLSLNSIIRDARKTPRAYRFLWPSTDPNCDPSQEPETYDPELGLQNAATRGVNIGVQMEEFYEADVLTLTDNYPVHLAAIQTDLTNNAV